MQQTPHLTVGGTDVPVDSRSRPLLRISTSTRAGPGEPATITLVGDLSLTTVGWAERVLGPWYARVANPEVQLDLSRVTFIDGRGLSFLISLQRLGHSGGHPLALSPDRMSTCLDRILEICNLTIGDSGLVADREPVRPR